jgi:hypothetical protein
MKCIFLNQNQRKRTNKVWWKKIRERGRLRDVEKMEGKKGYVTDTGKIK